MLWGYTPGMHKIFDTSFASVYPLYLAKVERKGRSKAELDTVIGWFTGFSERELHQQVHAATTFREFFSSARMNPAATLITGSVCGVKVQEVADPLMRQIRMLDKLVDELAKGRPLEKILRAQ